ncbi:hypothetical protein EV589_0246 [Mycobacterium sp. BK558]|nr:hypothetical protein EV589_0246 [Mycobacterium sp. BK558]
MKLGGGAAMAPLGEWSLEATERVGARGMPGTASRVNRAGTGDIPDQIDAHAISA